MKIIVDAFGGDNAPLEIIKGCESAVGELGCEILLVGDEKKIRECAQQNNVSLTGMGIKQADAVFEMDYHPKSVMREHSDTSLSVGLKALSDGEGDAFVSAGSTGALVLGAAFIVKRIKGVKRCAIASILPTNMQPVMLLDCGANAECRSEHLVQFAQMGSIYMHSVMGVENPSVGLANIGTEEAKGDTLRVETYQLLKTCNLNFTGNAEIRDIPFGGCDVVVADGFTGNVILKMYEGVAGAMMANLKNIFTKSAITKLSFLGVKPGLKDFKKRMDYTEFGGAPLMGIARPVIKAHGSSNAKAIKNAIRQACGCASSGMTDIIAQSIINEKTVETDND